MTTTSNPLISLHNSLPYLTDEDRSYNGYGASDDRPAPKYVRSIPAWERASEKIGQPYKEWTGPQFGAATKIYKATLAKYGLNQPGPTKPFNG